MTLTKDTTYVLTTRGWHKAKGFREMPSVGLFAVVYVTSEGLRYCEVEFSY